MAMLLARISQSHEIDVSTVRGYVRQRDIIFDAAVLLVFAFAYVVIAYQLVGAVTRRFPGDERFALVAADRELVERSAPMRRGTRPAGHDVPQCEPDEFGRGFIPGK
jgi:hypothetical protein